LSKKCESEVNKLNQSVTQTEEAFSDFLMEGPPPPPPPPPPMSTSLAKPRQLRVSNVSESKSKSIPQNERKGNYALDLQSLQGGLSRLKKTQPIERKPAPKMSNSNLEFLSKALKKRRLDIEDDEEWK
jgi:hypothetical protein